MAGPVVAAAVIFDLDKRRPAGLADSKLLSPRQRARLAPAIRRNALAWAIGIAEPAEIDARNIRGATLLAAERAVRALDPAPDALLTDFLEIPALALPTHAPPKADRDSASVAAASILAKHERDRLMDLYHAEFPHYGWDSNRGYPTPDHYAAIERHGPCVHHRLTFSGVGFFQLPASSPTYLRLAAAVQGCHESPGALESLAQEVAAAAERLAPSEARALRDALAARLARADAPCAPPR